MGRVPICQRWPDEVSDQRQFFHPKSMTVAFWFGFCDHLQRLYMGQPQRYLGFLYHWNEMAISL